MYCISSMIILALLAVISVNSTSRGDRAELSNGSYRLTVVCADGEVLVRLYDKLLNIHVAEGPYVSHVLRPFERGAIAFDRLEDVSLSKENDRITIAGEIAGLHLEHVFVLPKDRPVMEERIRIRNESESSIKLTDFEAGLQRRVTNETGQLCPELRNDRWVAVPFRHRADDPEECFNDFSVAELVTRDGYEPCIDKNQQCVRNPSRHRHSEGWAWIHGDYTLCIFKFDQEHMEFSIVSRHVSPEGKFIRFGGVCMFMSEPAVLTRIEPGEVVDFGMTRYQSTRGGYTEALYAFRRMLDEQGRRFPKDYDPPIHWNQLYNMSGAWHDRANKYTKAIIEQEAIKAKEYSCESLYLDPGWDTDFGTFLWGEEWLGPRKQFIKDMESKYGLKVSLHCPLATWMSHTIYTWGRNPVDDWPPESFRKEPPQKIDPKMKAPAIRDRRRNLALLPGAKPNASSVVKHSQCHRIEHLNDGWCGNGASWVAESTPAWAEIDLGAVFTISSVCLSNDRLLQFEDRTATNLRILVATGSNVDSNPGTWRTVAEYIGSGIRDEKIFTFKPTKARWVRIEIFKTDQGKKVRLDEIEIYEDEQVTTEEATAFEKNIKRGPDPIERMKGPLLCLGSKQYLEVAERRLLENCADGVVFLMFDGNWWNGGCVDPQHGHPVPYRMADHIQANVDLAQRIHARYPKVLIEMHDMLAGGSSHRLTPVYYKYGLPGSYDENWGFELMWNPIEDLKKGRATALYYYNLACNVPVYLHIDLRKDNEHCVVLWWYASTCRHLGIGGTHANPDIAESQKKAMRRYRELDRFYKRGEFFGIDEQIHLHVAPEENAFVVNLFNLSDEARTISGKVGLDAISLDKEKHYTGSVEWGRFNAGMFEVSLKMPPWSTEIGTFSALKDDQ